MKELLNFIVFSITTIYGSRLKKSDIGPDGDSVVVDIDGSLYLIEIKELKP